MRTRDMIAVALVRIAQFGNLLAKAELVNLIRYTVDEWDVSADIDIRVHF
jgi:hypothetical protein